jgi:hypothetical protein
MRFIQVFLVLLVTTLVVFSGHTIIDQNGSFQYVLKPIAMIISIVLLKFIYFDLLAPELDKKFQLNLLQRLLISIFIIGQLYNLLSRMDFDLGTFYYDFFKESYINEFWMILSFQAIVFAMMTMIIATKTHDD